MQFGEENDVQSDEIGGDDSAANKWFTYGKKTPAKLGECTDWENRYYFEENIIDNLLEDHWYQGVSLYVDWGDLDDEEYNPFIWIPLALACWKGAPFDVIELLLNLRPDSIMFEDVRGRSILHLACHGQPFDVIRFLIQREGRLAEKVTKKDTRNCFPLLYACYKPSFETIQWLVQVGGRETVVEPGNYEGDWLDLAEYPLSTAIENSASFQVIDLLIQEGGRSIVLQRGSALWLPLHSACSKDQPVEVIRFLVRMGGRETVLAETEDGELPLHLVKSPEVVDFLTQEGGLGTISKRDNVGQLALHSACEMGCPLDVVKKLVHIYPQATQIRDDRSWLPLDCTRVARRVGPHQPGVLEWLEERQKLDVIYMQVRRWEPQQMQKCKQTLAKRPRQSTMDEFFPRL